MSEKLGLECKLYRNTASYATPTWSEVTTIKDATLTLEKTDADFSSRGTGGWGASRGALKRATVEFEQLYDRSDTNCAAIEDAWFSGTPTEFAVMDGPIATSGSHGVRALYEVINWSRKESLEDPVTCSVTLKPTVSVNAPAQMTTT